MSTLPLNQIADRVNRDEVARILNDMPIYAPSGAIGDLVRAARSAADSTEALRLATEASDLANVLAPVFGK